MPALRCIVLTPEQTVLDERVDFVALPLFDGEIGILRGHTPMIGRLGFGELRIRRGDHTERYYVAGGFAEVSGDVVSVLTHRAVRGEELDAAVAREQIHDALARRANTPELIEHRDRTLAQARAQLRVARRAG